MKIYHFCDPQDYRFAQAIRRGTWYPQGSKICPECKTSQQTRVSPLIIEWEPGSDEIGDFTWPSLGADLVVVQNVKDAFETQFNGIKFEPVEFWQARKTRKPKKITRRTKPRIWLPYSGPTLWDVIPKRWCNLDLIKSNVFVVKICSTCGKTIYHRPPVHQRYLVIDPKTWGGEDIFRIYEYSNMIYCTDKVKDFVERSGFSNVSFKEVGEIPENG
jgi:hypothetical protein